MRVICTYNSRSSCRTLKMFQRRHQNCTCQHLFFKKGILLTWKPGVRRTIRTILDSFFRSTTSSGGCITNVAVLRSNEESAACTSCPFFNGLISRPAYGEPDMWLDKKPLRLMLKRAISSPNWRKIVKVGVCLVVGKQKRKGKKRLTRGCHSSRSAAEEEDTTAYV